MSKKDDIKRLWAEAFGDPRDWIEMYFDRVYRDSDAITLADAETGHVVSSLLLQPYMINFHGHEAPVSYISGAATRRNMRGRGLMSALMLDALDASRARGDILTLLIPASEYLYGFYARFGFAAAAFTDIKRYTALHAFAAPEGEPTDFAPIDNLFADSVYDGMARLERALPQATLLHSHRDFLNIIDDLSMDGGRCVAVADADGALAAIAFARPDPATPDIIRVDELLESTPAAGLAAMRELRAAWPGRPFALRASVADDGRQPSRRGMARIVNVQAILSLLADAYPKLQLNIHVADTLLRDNNGYFSIANGAVDRPATAPIPDFDVDITTLTNLLFSSPAIGRITGLPAQRLHLALLLD